MAYILTQFNLSSYSKGLHTDNLLLPAISKLSTLSIFIFFNKSKSKSLDSTLTIQSEILSIDNVVDFNLKRVSSLS